MNNTFYFIRHADKLELKDKPVDEWPLSEKGIKQAQEIADSGKFDEIDLIFTSSLERTYQTAKPISDKIRREITKCPEFDELKMGNNHWFGEEFESAIKDCLTHLYTSEHEWETAHNALERFSNKIEEIDKDHDDKKILIVSHNVVINLFFAKLLDKLDHVYERGVLTKDPMYNYIGIVQNDKIIQDIVKK